MNKQAGGVVEWAESLYTNAMRIAAAGVLKSEGSLENAASVLEDAGFRVPYGYITRHYGEEVDIETESDPTARLGLWVAAEAGRLVHVVEAIGYRLAATGRLLDEGAEGEGGEDV